MLALRGFGGNQLLLRSLKKENITLLLLSLKLWEVAAGAREAATEEALEKPAVKQPTAKQIREAEKRGGRETRSICFCYRYISEQVLLLFLLLSSSHHV